MFGPLNKKLYADTLETFPAAQTLLAASVCALAGLVNLALSTKKDLLRKNAVEVKIEQDNEDREEAEETEEVREANGQQHQDQQLEDVGTPKY